MRPVPRCAESARQVGNEPLLARSDSKPAGPPPQNPSGRAARGALRIGSGEARMQSTVSARIINLPKQDSLSHQSGQSSETRPRRWSNESDPMDLLLCSKDMKPPLHIQLPCPVDIGALISAHGPRQSISIAIRQYVMCTNLPYVNQVLHSTLFPICAAPCSGKRRLAWKCVLANENVSRASELTSSAAKTVQLAGISTRWQQRRTLSAHCRPIQCLAEQAKKLIKHSHSSQVLNSRKNPSTNTIKTMCLRQKIPNL